MANKGIKQPSTGPGNQAQIRFNEGACADKVAESGFHFFYGNSNSEGLLGALDAEKIVPKFRPIYIYNNSSTVAFVAFGDTGLAAPTGGANGIPIAPNSGMVLSSGDNTRIRASAATTFGYVAEDNVVEK